MTTSSNSDTESKRTAAREAMARQDFVAARALLSDAADAGSMEALVELGLPHGNG